MNGRRRWFCSGRDRCTRGSRLHNSRSPRASLRSRRRCGWLGTRRPRGSLLRFFLRFGSSFCLSFGFCNPLNSLSYLLRNVCGNRTRVRFLLRDAETGQKVNDRFGLDLQFAG
jgi:hypothetical protein